MTHATRRRRGISFVYIILVLAILFFFVSVGVDMGRVRVARSQLQTAADAAAFAGAQVLPSVDHTISDARAVAVAAQNFTDGTAVALQPGNDIEYGLYRLNSRIYTPVGQQEAATGHTVQDSDANAIKVTAVRTSARSNPINLLFARLIGQSTFDVTTVAIAFVTGGPQGFGIIGLDWVRMTGTTQTDSYDPTVGPYGGGNINDNGSVASNGNITLVGTCEIHGDARPGMDGIVDAGGNTTITGWTAPLDEPLVFPPDPFSPPGSNNNTLITPASSINLNSRRFDPGNDPTVLPTTGGGASYVFSNWKMTGNNASVTINGPATIWISGDFDMTGGQLTIVGNDTNARVIFYVNGDFKQTGGSISNPYPQMPGALTISMTGAGTEFRASAQLGAHIYAPTSDVVLHGNANNPPADFYGWVVGQTLTLNGNSQIHYDESLNDGNQPRRSILVK